MTTSQRGSSWKGLPIGCAVTCLVGFGLLCGGMVWLLSGHEGGVSLSNDMEQYATQYLDEHTILNSSESVIAYYDVTLSLDGTEAVILTTERLIYHKSGKTVIIAISEITDIRHRNETMIGDIIEIDSRSGIPMKIEIAPLNQGETFLNALRNAWKRSK